VVCLKNIFTKTISIALCTFLLTSSVTGCRKNDTNKTSENADNKEVAVVKLWNNGGSAKDLLMKKVDEFNNTTGKEKGIKLEYKVFGDDYKNVIDIAIAGGEAPDLFSVPDVLSNYIKKNAIMPVDEMPGGPEFIKQLNPDIAKVVENGKRYTFGKVYNIPVTISVIALFYNKDMFKKAGIVDENREAKPPTTWDELTEYAKRLANPENKEYGIIMPFAWGGYAEWELKAPFLSSVGHGLFDEKTGEYKIKDYKVALKWLTKIKEDKSFFPGPEGLGNDPARAQFAEGRIGMKFGASWDVAVYRDQFPAKMDWGIAPIPVINPEKRYKQFSSVGGATHISTTAKKNDLAKVFEVYKWLISDEMQEEFYLKGKGIPISSKIINKCSPLIEDKIWKEMGELSKISCQIHEPSPGNLEGDSFSAVVMKVWSGLLTPEEALKDIDERYTAGLKRRVEENSIDLTPYIDPNFDISLTNE